MNLGCMNYLPQDKQNIYYNQGEYFIHSTDSNARLIFFGKWHKKISRTGSSLLKWECNPIDYDEIESNGAEALENMWEQIPSGNTIYVVRCNLFL